MGTQTAYQQNLNSSCSTSTRRTFLQRRDRLTAMFDGSRCVVVYFSVTFVGNRIDSLSVPFAFTRTDSGKEKTPAGWPGI